MQLHMRDGRCHIYIPLEEDCRKRRIESVGQEFVWPIERSSLLPRCPRNKDPVEHIVDWLKDVEPKFPAGSGKRQTCREEVGWASMQLPNKGRKPTSHIKEICQIFLALKRSKIVTNPTTTTQGKIGTIAPWEFENKRETMFLVDWRLSLIDLPTNLVIGR